MVIDGFGSLQAYCILQYQAFMLCKLGYWIDCMYWPYGLVIQVLYVHAQLNYTEMKRGQTKMKKRGQSEMKLKLSNFFFTFYLCAQFDEYGLYQHVEM